MRLGCDTKPQGIKGKILQLEASGEGGGVEGVWKCVCLEVCVCPEEL